ncbi:hypothetical protein RGE_45640 [Rubrivivax gelatinosus IL144]|uniref:DUF3800 domain-containing protein n=2 Tax=Rubrivivax gelatinosus TaxID=28068 RepID=I0HY12_RUBGI|nr:hypothetical protein RGE_45640 [Rubrivivax gelatinosus IL144]
MPPEVHFDEAGNTGAALLDPNQPVFVLASSDFGREEANDLLNLVRTPQTQEVKFTSLKKSDAGRRRLLAFLASPLMTPMRVKVSITHKRYMAMCKAVDIIEETLANRAGLDLYERGANIAIANLHYYVTPVFCGEARFELFLSTFVRMIRTPNAGNKAEFFEAVRALYENCSEPRHRASFGPYLIAQREIDEILDGVNYLALDPAIGSVFYQLSVWGTQFGEEFYAIHDESKPVAAERETFAAMMNPAASPVVIGYDRRKFEFPLRAGTLKFADSRTLPQLQVVDLLAGAAAYFAGNIARGAKDELTEQLQQAGIERFIVHAIWPAPVVTPRALGTEEIGGVNAVDFMVKALAGERI